MVSTLPSVPVFPAASVRAADANAQRALGLAGRTLMQAAAAAALEDCRALWPEARSCGVVCGPGNNGGDGYDFATAARAAGWQPRVHALAPLESLPADARAAAEGWRATGGTIEFWPSLDETTLAGEFLAALASSEVLVDAVFGSGLSRPPRGHWATAIRCLNEARRPVLSLDLPSGMDADTGRELGLAVRARHTSTFVGWKAGLFLAPGLAGTVRLHELDVPPAAYPPAEPLLQWLSPTVLQHVPARARDAHKGRHGHVVVIGGDHGMPGAVRLAGEAALRAGAGRVTVLTRALHAPLVPIGCPELMAVAIEDPAAAEPWLATADAIVVGPGLGRGEWGRRWLATVLDSTAPCPRVFDAEALRLLAELPARALPPGCVLTPHPGEAAALLGMATENLQANRLEAVRHLAERWQAAVVLKGAASLVTGPGMPSPFACSFGNPGMGTAGMGDVLAGVVAALLAQHRCDPAWQTDEVFGAGGAVVVALAVLAHAAAGDAAACVAGERGLLATDLLLPLRRLLNGRGAA